MLFLTMSTVVIYCKYQVQNSILFKQKIPAGFWHKVPLRLNSKEVLHLSDYHVTSLIFTAFFFTV